MEDQAVYEKTSALTRTYRKNVICPECKGEGTIEQRKFYGHTEGWYHINTRCELCNGSRVIGRIVTVKYKPIKIDLILL